MTRVGDRGQSHPFKGAVEFSWHFIDKLVENRFDPMICQEIEVDHGIQVPMELFWGRPPSGR